MINWKLIVKDFGKIKSAEVEKAPLTLFIGDNNSGKSFLMSLLWGIEYFGVRGLLGNDYYTVDEYAIVESWVTKHLAELTENDNVNISIEEILKALEILLNKQIKKNKNSIVKSVFNSQQAEIGELKIKFETIRKANIEFNAIEDDEGLICSVDIKNRKFSFARKKLGTVENNRAIKDFIIPQIYAILLNINYSKNESRDSIYLPAARTGFMLTKDVINKVGRNNTFNIFGKEEEITPFVRPINHFLDVMGELSTDVYDKKNELVKYIEKDVTNGCVEFNSMPNKEVEYLPDGYKKGIPLRLTSAVVTELSPLVLILKHQKYINRFYYEEPEMCLHPQLQHKMGKILCRIANSGIGIVATTHSDIILTHVNNMIRLRGLKNREEICDKYDYTEKDFLNSEHVKVYQFESNSRGKTIVEELICGENGFEVPTFNNALDKIMNEAYDIQG